MVLALAFALSLTVHVVLLAFLPLPSHAAGDEVREQEFAVYLEPPAPPPPEDVIEEAPQPLLPPEIALGLNAPLPPSLNWLGFTEHIPQQAPMASTEQAAFTDEPIAAAPHEATAQVEPQPQPSPPAKQSSPEVPGTEETERLADQSPTPSEAVPQETPNDQSDHTHSPPFTSMLVDMVDQMVREQADQAIKQETARNQQENPPLDMQPAPPASQPSPPMEPAAAPPSNKPVAPQPTPGASNQGIPSDKQSQATSVIEVPRENWQLGKPLAGKGMELKPRRPTFTLLTLITAAPGNPLCEMSFNHEGVVKRARIVESSGDSRIDEGILNSLYYWRAAGEEIQKLQPGQVLDIQIRIMLTRRKR